LPNRHRPHERAHARGFSLLEVLVAFLVLSLVATALFRLFSGALTNAGAAEDYSRAIMLAESRIAEAAAGQLREGTQSGAADDDRMRWTVRIANYTAPDVSADVERGTDAIAMRMYRISADVTFAGIGANPRTVSLSTIRIGLTEAALQ
jgi:general secretion pathway protein I